MSFALNSTENLYIFVETSVIVMAHEENISVGVFIDGGYYAKINEGFADKREVNLKNLLSYICQKISQDNKIDRRYLYITECHYYRGRYRAADAKAKNLLYDERKFEDMLIENDASFKEYLNIQNGSESCRFLLDFLGCMCDNDDSTPKKHGGR